MSLDQQSLLLAQAVGADIKTLYASVGTLSSLTTTEKENLVVAINSLKANIEAVDLTGVINDNSVNTTSTWSSQKIQTALDQLKNEILAEAPEAFDTLKEISDYLATNTNNTGYIISEIGHLVQFDAAQTKSVEEKLQACINIGIYDGDAVEDTDLTLLYRTAKGEPFFVEDNYVAPGYVANGFV